MNDDYTIVGVSNRRPDQDYYCLDEFYKSLRGEEVVVYGQIPGEYIGLTDRPRILYHEIKKGSIKTKNIFFTDMWDLVFIDSMDEIFEKHKALGGDITIGAEKNCFPDTHKEAFDALPWTSSYRYLNCGTIIGSTEAVLAMLEDMHAADIPRDYYDFERQCMVHPNEQVLYQESFLRQPVKIVMDYNQEITQCMHDVQRHEVELVDGRVRNVETGTLPSIIHWNGGGKTGGTMDMILKYLNLR